MAILKVMFIIRSGGIVTFFFLSSKAEDVLRLISNS
jgi:hypothetical protein